MPIPSINRPPNESSQEGKASIVQDAPKKYTIPSVKKQLKLRLPEEKNLIAVHNIDNNKIPEIAENGIASPSIGIVHKDEGFKSFGDVSLILHPSKINPKGTPVYDRDVFTPRFRAEVSKEGVLNPERYEAFKKEVHEAVDRHTKVLKGE
jgi:hypothetical protein